MNKKKILVIIPGYNEGRTIAKVIKKTKKYVEDIIVIDDGSVDDTFNQAKKAGAGVIRHTLNKGVGAAQRTGYIYGIRNNYDYLIQLDADEQHNPDYIPKMLDIAYKKDYDVIIGSRFLTKSYKDYSFIRKTGIRFFTGFVNLIAGIKVTDVTSGYKLIKVDKLKKLSRTSDLHPAVEQMLDMHKKKLRIKEIPMVMPLRKI